MRVMVGGNCAAILATGSIGMESRDRADAVKPAQNAVSCAGSWLAIPPGHLSTAGTGTGWLPATVPGDVHLDLLANKKIDDPFYRDNEPSYSGLRTKAGSTG